LAVPCIFAQEEKQSVSSFFIVSPMGGVVRSEATFGSGPRQTKLAESGPLQGINLLYAKQNIVVGNLIHNSKTNSSNENGYLFFTHYYFNGGKPVQPMVGMYAEYVTIYSQLTGQSSAPLSSLDVNTSVLVLQPVVGVSFVGTGFRVTPFMGYFNEQVESSASSPGMRISGQIRNGMKSSNSDVLDYASLGSRLEFATFHFIRLDAKFYFRFKQNDEPLLTTRNRVDFLLSRSFGVSVKFDYFQDKYESTTFTFVGPTFVF
jgi:hypothetical protein